MDCAEKTVPIVYVQFDGETSDSENVTGINP